MLQSSPDPPTHPTGGHAGRQPRSAKASCSPRPRPAPQRGAPSPSPGRPCAPPWTCSRPWTSTGPPTPRPGLGFFEWQSHSTHPQIGWAVHRWDLQPQAPSRSAPDLGSASPSRWHAFKRLKQLAEVKPVMTDDFHCLTGQQPEQELTVSHRAPSPT